MSVPAHHILEVRPTVMCGYLGTFFGEIVTRGAKPRLFDPVNPYLVKGDPSPWPVRMRCSCGPSPPAYAVKNPKLKSGCAIDNISTLANKTNSLNRLWDIVQNISQNTTRGVFGRKSWTGWKIETRTYISTNVDLLFYSTQNRRSMNVDFLNTAMLNDIKSHLVAMNL